MSVEVKKNIGKTSVAKLDEEKQKGKSLWMDAWTRLLRNKAAMLGAIIVVLNIIIALFAPLIAPYPYWEQTLTSNNVAPPWVVNLFPVMKPSDQTASLTPPTQWDVLITNGQEVSRGEVIAVKEDGTEITAIMNGQAYVDGTQIGVTQANMEFYDIDETWDVKLNAMDLMRPVDPNTVIATKGDDQITASVRSIVDINDTAIRIREQDGGYVKLSTDYPVGADALGRDLLSRIIYGSRISLSVAFVVPLVSLIVGLTVGLVSGYVGGWTDNILMRFVDIMYAFPTILLIILLMAFFRNSFADAAPGSFRYVVGQWDAALGGMLFIFIGIGITSWMQLARLTRGQVLSVREKEYIEAARSIGTDWFTIIRQHVLPNILGPIIVAETLTIPRYISYEAFLSFIGLGVNPPTPSWGAMISEGAEAIATYPNQALFPAMALFFVMFAFNFLGDGLRDALDPRMRGVD